MNIDSEQMHRPENDPFKVVIADVANYNYTIVPRIYCYGNTTRIWRFTIYRPFQTSFVITWIFTLKSPPNSLCYTDATIQIVSALTTPAKVRNPEFQSHASNKQQAKQSPLFPNSFLYCVIESGWPSKFYFWCAESALHQINLTALYVTEWGWPGKPLNLQHKGNLVNSNALQYERIR